MGEWSEYFEDCPEANPANYAGDRFDPAAAARLRGQQEAKQQMQQKVREDSEALTMKMFAMAAEAKAAAAKRTTENRD
jgi:hypothetical protein